MNSDTDSSQRAETAEANTAYPTGESPQGAGRLSYQAKIETRQYEWRVNRPLLWTSIVLSAILVFSAGWSYWYHSRQAAQVYKTRAEAASDAGNFEGYSKWVQRYLLMQPNDKEAVYELAIAADDAVDDAAHPGGSEHYKATDLARKHLSSAIGQLREYDVAKVHDLRRRLIERLLDLGGTWYREAERQIIILDADPEDVLMNQAMARALVGQWDPTAIGAKTTEPSRSDESHWNWLAKQKPGEVLLHVLPMNQENIDLIALLVELAGKSTDAFDLVGDTNDHKKRSLAKRMQPYIEILSNNIDSRSRLIQYKFELECGDSQNADELLASSADETSARLARYTAGSGDSSAEDAFWDFSLLLEAARWATEANPPLARSYYDQLLASDVELVPRSTMETLYLLAGAQAEASGNPDRGLQIWKLGLESVNPNSLDLLGAVAHQYSRRANTRLVNTTDSVSLSDDQAIKDASESLKQFREAIEQYSQKLISAPETELNREARSQLGRKIEIARWRQWVLRASLDRIQGNMLAATDGLRRVVASSVNVPNDEKLLATVQLASLYQSQAVWDQAALALEQATQLDPQNASLRVQAAQAWGRAGDRERQAMHWSMVANSDQMELQLAAIEAELDQQQRLPKSQRDFSGIRAKFRRISEQHGAPTPSQDEPKNVETFRRLQLVELMLPPSGTDIDEHLRSPSFADALLQLAEQYPEDASIQAVAAQRLAAAARSDAASEAADRLDAILGSDDYRAVSVRARMMGAAGKLIEAAQFLLAAIDTNATDAESADAQFSELELRRLAAAFAIAAKETELAYQALADTPDDQKSIATLFSLAQLSLQLPNDSKFLHRAEPASGPKPIAMNQPQANPLYQGWFEKLKAAEGAEGTYWRFLAAVERIDQLRNDRQEIERDDPRIAEARQWTQEILAVRPRWGEAISLEGWLLAIEGKSSQAVSILQQGIAAGDERMATRLRLWEQLVLLGRESEVEEDIQRVAAASGQSIGEFASTRVELAQRQGEFQRSLEVARENVLDQPNNYLSHLILARAAAAAAAVMSSTDASPSEADRRSQLLAEARNAVQSASQFEDAKPESIASTELSIALATNDETLIRKQIKTIQDGNLPKLSKLLLASDGLIAIADFELALPLLEQAEKLDPSAQTQLKLARHYKRMQRSSDEISVLRRAQRSDPNNARLRNQLAHALATRDGKHLDWQELGQLLELSDNVTSLNRFYYAILLSTHGEAAQQNHAIEILQELVAERSSRSNDAARVLAAVWRRQLEALPLSSQNETKEAKQLDSEIRSVYESLVRIVPVQVVDLYRYADYLLSRGKVDDLPSVRKLIDQQRGLDPGSTAALDIEIRYIDQLGDPEKVPMIVQNWVEDAAGDEQNSAQYYSIAGTSLLKRGFVNQGLGWFEKAYEQDPSLLSTYVSALSQSDQKAKAQQLCIDHFNEYQDTRSVTLMIEVILGKRVPEVGPAAETIIEQALVKYNRDAGLLEAVATLRMQTKQFEEAIELYQLARQIDPFQVRTLNNLAMAFSEIPGREAEGIKVVEQAIKLAGEIPELLDTKGVVLMKAGRLEDAEQTFREAFRDSNEPRYQFHLVLALLAQGNDAEAHQEWKKVNLKNLDPMALTAMEKVKLEELKETLET
ncbi:Tetratricopeptide repeat protein [Novipirellula aureliae]|uniref:Tetratricopeptide repeat protein n=1 Tax=Novipirellula aureliae TaxID=2527966 RepID=A0A5C6E9C0_9BACT|nr:hypothetical protein [Novipirellula aureliae]TWU44321.1 Tetratricopeptide repeat protein [Novipirellula aureliae]